METRAGMVACRVAEEVMCWYLKEKDTVVLLYLLAMLISMRAVNETCSSVCQIKTILQSGVVFRS